MRCLSTLAVFFLVGAAPATALAQAEAGGGNGVLVSVPWRPGNAEGFQLGAVEERRVKSAQGLLPVTIYRPGVGSSPFVVLMHGCGGLGRATTWTAWVRPWIDLFQAHGVGAAVVDSFGPRGVDQVCNT